MAFLVPESKSPSGRKSRTIKTTLPDAVSISADEIKSTVAEIDWSEIKGMGGQVTWSKNTAKSLSTFRIDPTLLNLPESILDDLQSAEVTVQLGVRITVAY